MPVPSTIDDLSTTASSNSPSGSETPTEGDNYIRTLSAFIALLRDKLDGTSNTGTITNATFSGTMAGAASWDGVQTFNANPAGRITSGTYTPTITQGVNCSGGTPSVNGTFKWMRIGNIVHVSGWLGATGSFVSSNTYSEIILTLPVASAFTQQYDATGVCSFSNASNASGQGEYVYADTGGDRLICSFYPSTTSGAFLFVEATYEVK